MEKQPAIVDNPTNKKLTLSQRMRIAIRRSTKKKRGYIIPLFVSLVLLTAMLLIGLSPSRHGVYGEEAAPNHGMQLSFVGDVMLGRYVEGYADEYGYDHFFDGVSPLWANSDHVFANLECAVLVNDEENYVKDEKNIHLPATPEAVLAMQRSGIDTITYANNHSRDFGKQAFIDATAFFDSIGLNYSGTTLRYDERGEHIVTCEIETGDKTVGFIGVNNVIYEGLGSGSGMLTGGNAGLFGYVNWSLNHCDLTVVYVHWGKEYNSSPTDEQRELARKLIDAGADIVIGSHPHCLQPVEKYSHGIIFYSLGNFIMDQNNTFTRDSVLVQYNETEDGSRFFELIPLRIVDGRPEVTDNRFYTSRIRTVLTKYLDDSDYYVEDGHIIINF